MRLEFVPTHANVIKFPVERRVRPSLTLLRHIAPAADEVAGLAASITAPPIRSMSRLEGRASMAACVSEHVIPIDVRARQHVLNRLLRPYLLAAIQACGHAEWFLARAKEAGDWRLASSPASSDIAGSIARAAHAASTTAVKAFIAAFQKCEEAEGAAEQAGLTISSGAERPFEDAVQHKAGQPSSRALFGFSCRLVFLCNENLEVGRALGRRIHRPVCEDKCRARSDDGLCLVKERGWQPALLRRQKNILVRFALTGGCHFRPAQMPLRILSLKGAKHKVLQRRNDLRIWYSRPANFYAISVDVNCFVCAADNHRDWTGGRFIRIPSKLAGCDRLALFAALGKEKPGCTVVAGAECWFGRITVAPFIVTPKSSLENSSGSRAHPWESG